MRRAICVAILIASCASTQAPAKSKMERFLGEWEFTECWRTLNPGESDCVEYQIDISSAGEKTTVDIDLDGYMAMSRIRAEGKLEDNVLKVLYVEDRERPLTGNYKQGDELFELSFRGHRLYTTWNKMKPELAKDQKPCFCFARVGKASGHPL
jgi:hypothetical protein